MQHWLTWRWFVVTVTCTWHVAAWDSEYFLCPSPPLTPGRSNDAGSGTSSPLWTAWREPEQKKHFISAWTHNPHDTEDTTISTQSQDPFCGFLRSSTSFSFSNDCAMRLLWGFMKIHFNIKVVTQNQWGGKWSIDCLTPCLSIKLPFGSVINYCRKWAPLMPFLHSYEKMISSTWGRLLHCKNHLLRL